MATTPARVAEADRVELAYYWAVSTLGNSMAVEAKELWNDHVPSSIAGARRAHRSYVAALLVLLLRYRARAHRMALAYYRLNRALRIGSTVSTGDEAEGDTVSLEQLRSDFDAELDAVEALTSGDPLFTTGNPENDFIPTQPDPRYIVDDDAIPVDLVIDLDSIIDALDEQAETELREAAENLGTKNLEKKLTKAARRSDSDGSGEEDAKDKAGNRQAAAAMRIMMNAARGLVYDLGSTDKKIVGWVRYSQTGDPCGFCAMLIAREDMYRTRKTAQHEGKNQVEDKYHDNCKCVTIPIFDRDQFDASSLSAQHNEYKSLWQKNIAGRYSGDDALTEWRSLIRARSAGTNQTTQAPGEAA